MKWRGVHELQAGLPDSCREAADRGVDPSAWGKRSEGGDG